MRRRIVYFGDPGSLSHADIEGYTQLGYAGQKDDGAGWKRFH